MIDDQRGCPTYVGHLAEATRALLDGEAGLGVRHLAAGGDCTWAELAEAIFEDAGLACRVRRISSSEFGAKSAATGGLDPPQRERGSAPAALARRPRACSNLAGAVLLSVWTTIRPASDLREPDLR